MSIEIITLLLFLSMFVVLTTGLPIAFSIGSIAVIFAIFMWGPARLPIIAAASFTQMSNVNLAAIPLFVFLGYVFSHSGVGDDLFETVNVWMGHIPGGLLIGCLLISILFGAICGDLAATIFMLGAIALPPMLDRGYNMHLVLGAIGAGGLLGLIIPPSIEIIVYCAVTGQSVGKMYLGCLIPGLMLGGFYMLYVWIRCKLNPKLGPPQGLEITWKTRFASLKAVILPLILVIFLMVGIYGGIMSPLEASSVGAIGAIIVAAIYRRLSFKVLVNSMTSTLKIAGFLAWLLMALGCFTAVYEGMGASDLANKLATAMPGGGWMTIALMQLMILGFGMIMDDWAIILIFGPIFSNVVESIGFDTLWYGVLFLINMQLAFLTPPYGFALFFMKAACPPKYQVSIIDCYKGAFPFILLALLAFILVMIFPKIATLIPNMIIG